MSWFETLRISLQRLFVIVAAAAVLSGCAATPPGQVNDPLEPLNRQIFAFNDAVDTVLIRPGAVVYRDLMPRPIKMVLGNLIDHLTLPLTIVHDLLQGKPDRAQVAFGRFFINTIIGVGGLFDVATPHGLKLHREDAGQTLAVHGVESGPYLVLPLLGPSNLRDGVGTLIDWFIDPVGIAAYVPDNGQTLRITRAGATIIVRREALLEPLDALRQSLDYYAATRAAYAQRRQLQINDGQVNTPSFNNDPFAAAEEANKAN